MLFEKTVEGLTEELVVQRNSYKTKSDSGLTRFRSHFCCELLGGLRPPHLQAEDNVPDSPDREIVKLAIKIMLETSFAKGKEGLFCLLKITCQHCKQVSFLDKTFPFVLSFFSQMKAQIPEIWSDSDGFHI